MIVGSLLSVTMRATSMGERHREVAPEGSTFTHPREIGALFFCPHHLLRDPLGGSSSKHARIAQPAHRPSVAPRKGWPLATSVQTGSARSRSPTRKGVPR